MSQQASPNPDVGATMGFEEGGSGTHEFTGKPFPEPESDDQAELDDLDVTSLGTNAPTAELLRSEDSVQVQRKLQLFGCPMVQASMDKVWSMLPHDDQGELSMNGYVECHLRFQKCLSKDFEIQRSIASAIEDWDEDVADGQQTMSAQEFSMFLFELCSLWCGPRVSLQLYLLFLHAVFIAITDARGSHTVGLKPLEAIERLPKAFFDLLTAQGWTKKPKGVDEDDDYDTWYSKNLTPESQDVALEQAQHQVFQVTHDARAFALGPPQEVQEEYRRALEKVRGATDTMSKVQTKPTQALVPLQIGRKPLRARDEGALQLARAEAPARPRRSGSAPGRAVAALGNVTVARPEKVRLEAVPVGRAYETRRADNICRGLVIASTDYAPAATAPSPLAKAGFAVVGAPPAHAVVPSTSAMRLQEPWPPPEWTGVVQADTRGNIGLLESKLLMPAYELPRAPMDVYRKQVEPLMKNPSDLIFEAIQEYKRAKALQQEPFRRVLSKLTDKNRPDPGSEPRVSGGPMGAPTEPLWSEMNHRLQKILAKQGKRAERKRKRRLRARQQNGARPPKPTPGRELREYLDRHAADLRGGLGGATSQFVEMVHEKRQVHQERGEEIQKRFSVPLVADGFCDGSQIVRPVYVPPPNVGA